VAIVVQSLPPSVYYGVIDSPSNLLGSFPIVISLLLCRDLEAICNRVDGH
jgi:hypothetical protein